MKKIYIYIFFLPFLIGKNQTWYGKNVAIFDWEWGRNSAPRDGQKRPCLTISDNVKN